MLGAFMKTFTALCVSAILLCSAASSAQTASTPNYHVWWHDQYPNKPLNSPNAKKLPLIAVRGNKFVDPQGNTILFRGMAIADPAGEE